MCEAPLHEREADEHFLACVKIETVMHSTATDWVGVWSWDNDRDRLRALRG